MSETYQLTGTVREIKETQTFSSGFTKREFIVVTDDDKYPNEIKFEAHKERCEILNKLLLNDRVIVSFNVRGSEYKGNHYVNLVAWKAELLERNGGTPNANQEATAAQEDSKDDIPF